MTHYIIGLFMNTTMYTHGLGACLAVHVLNNCVAAFFPITRLDPATIFTSPLLLLGIIETIVTFCIFNAFAWRSISTDAGINGRSLVKHAALPECDKDDDDLTIEHYNDAPIFNVYHNDVLLTSLTRSHLPVFSQI